MTHNFIEHFLVTNLGFIEFMIIFLEYINIENPQKIIDDLTYLTHCSIKYWDNDILESYNIKFLHLIKIFKA